MENVSFPEGVRAQLQVTGIGKLKPNVLLLGYQRQWRATGRKTVDDYFSAIESVALPNVTTEFS